MADIDGIPFLELLLRSVVLNDPERIILCVSYKKEVIINYFGKDFYGIPIEYSIENEPLGTGGAIKQAFDYFNVNDAIVLNGDSYIQCDIGEFYKNVKDDNLALVLKKESNASRFGLVVIDKDRVVDFQEKSENVVDGFINAGIYKLNKSIFDNISKKIFSFEKEILEPYIKKFTSKYFIADDYFIDIGIPESYFQACRELKQLILGKSSTKALFLDRDGVINIDINYLHRKQDCVF